MRLCLLLVDVSVVQVYYPITNLRVLLLEMSPTIWAQDGQAAFMCEQTSASVCYFFSHPPPFVVQHWAGDLLCVGGLLSSHVYLVWHFLPDHSAHRFGFGRLSNT